MKANEFFDIIEIKCVINRRKHLIVTAYFLIFPLQFFESLITIQVFLVNINNSLEHNRDSDC